MVCTRIHPKSQRCKVDLAFVIEAVISENPWSVRNGMTPEVAIRLACLSNTPE